VSESQISSATVTSRRLAVSGSQKLCATTSSSTAVNPSNLRLR